MSEELTEQTTELAEYVSAEWEDAFFTAYLSQYGVIAEAARAAGISYRTVKKRVVDYPAFKERLATAKELVKEEVKDRIRYENFRRAFEPQRKPIYQRGVYVGEEMVWDNKHLEWLSERMLPEEFYMPARIEFGADAGDGSIHFKLQLNPGQQDEDAEALE